ncbi:DUF6268 family outer membrane beta-barrel protein [Aequorivita echinoideorum]|uniref:Uncharacterized protein n=1 Tax=Aequorivita echinoideorum TaxID=1549647 RepID=A0ABS5S8P3_9FLAO|nr:DUF6268 family outer membrane beta-barrel protein [Aequorivita echinoideorum]MBT0608245.1 hypothetical protein [Aequorivita echinoideorum]
MKKKNLVPLMLLFFTTAFFAQTTDLARIEYLNIPFSKSDNNISRYRAILQGPIPTNLEKKNFLVVGLEYRYVDINLKDMEDMNAFSGLNQETQLVQDNLVTSVQQMDIYLGYTWKHSENWRFGARAGVKIQSDFEQKLQSDDYIYEAAVYAILDRKNDTVELKKPYRLVLGLSYSTTPGRNFPLPILNYYKEFKPNWTYTLGVPKTNIRHYLNDNHKDALQLFATLDNIYANIQQNFIPTSPQNVTNAFAESIQQTIVIGGLGYEHFFTDHLLLYVYAAHSVYNDFRLEDGDGEKIYIINDELSPYLRTGFKFKF